MLTSLRQPGWVELIPMAERHLRGFTHNAPALDRVARSS